MVELTLEQELAVRAIALQTETMTTEQIKTQLLELYTQMVVMEARYKEEIRKEWRICD